MTERPMTEERQDVEGLMRREPDGMCYATHWRLLLGEGDRALTVRPYDPEQCKGAGPPWPVWIGATPPGSFDGAVCHDCGDTGWRENRVEGRYPCTCLTETEPWQRLEARADTLQREVEAMRADRERLDWLEANNVSVRASSQPGYLRYQLVSLDGSTDARLLADRNATLREAIDAARALATEGGE